VSRNYTIEQVANIVDSNGLDYAIMHYMKAESIKDDELRSAWNKAHGALSEIERILEPFAP
jgi:hypothetical protein